MSDIDINIIKPSIDVIINKPDINVAMEKKYIHVKMEHSIRASDIVSGTYAEIKALRDNGELSISNKYLITDYKTIVNR